MYDTSYFKAGHPDEVIAYMRAHPFALICGADEGGNLLRPRFHYYSNKEKINYSCRVIL